MSFHHEAVITVEPVTDDMRAQFSLPPEATRAIVGHWDGGLYLLSTDDECANGIEVAAAMHAALIDAAYRGAA